jgi:glycosyltransferase involved in cell wall biosynthesis
MKILWKGNIFNPTGIATANREMVRALKRKGIPVQCSDPWHDGYDFTKGCEDWNNSINVRGDDLITVFADYPQFWTGGYGKLVGYFLHEGTKLHPGWSEQINLMNMMLVPSKATRNLFRWNDVWTSLEIVPYGTNPEIYKPVVYEKDENYLFLSINSWTGLKNDRKGTDILIQAFDEEFKPEDKVKLVLKIGTFWQKVNDEMYVQAITNLLGHYNENIVLSSNYVNEEDLATYYQKADCFVSPTRGEAFGLTILNAMASGLPVIVTKDPNSGHMDFCRHMDSVLFIDAPKMAQADLRFFAEGNMQPIPDKESLKKQMRYAFENRVDLWNKGLKNSEKIREEWTWDKAAEKLIETLKKEGKNGSINKHA